MNIKKMHVHTCACKCAFTMSFILQARYNGKQTCYPFMNHKESYDRLSTPVSVAFSE